MFAGVKHRFCLHFFFRLSREDHCKHVMPTLKESVAIIRLRINNRGQLAISLINRSPYANLHANVVLITKDIRHL